MGAKALWGVPGSGPCAVGSLQPDVHPGDFVFCDQFVDRTTGRKDTYYDGPKTVHLSSADPYCDELRKLGIAAAGELGLRYHQDGTMVVIQGPRFSTRAESKWFSSLGWKVINMTGYPEVTTRHVTERVLVTITMWGLKAGRT